jgi:hypothetical protein
MHTTHTKRLKSTENNGESSDGRISTTKSKIARKRTWLPLLAERAISTAPNSSPSSFSSSRERSSCASGRDLPKCFLAPEFALFPAGVMLSSRRSGSSGGETGGIALPVVEGPGEKSEIVRRLEADFDSA